MITHAVEQKQNQPKEGVSVHGNQQQGSSSTGTLTENGVKNKGDNRQQAPQINQEEAKSTTINTSFGEPAHQFGRISVYAKPFPGSLQAKLTVNKPGDRYEQEADLVADKIMREPDKGAVHAKPHPISIVQRACINCEAEEQAENDEEEDTFRVETVIQKKSVAYPGENLVQRKGTRGASTVSSAVQHTLQSQGQHLDNDTRLFMEGRFGHDFSKVQIHNNSLAHQSAKDIHALAYTHQNHIVFGKDQYQPQTASGKRLLAHELTHTIQQQSSPSGNALHRKDGDKPADRVSFRIKVPQDAASVRALNDLMEIMIFGEVKGLQWDCVKQPCTIESMRGTEIGFSMPRGEWERLKAPEAKQKETADKEAYKNLPPAVKGKITAEVNKRYYKASGDKPGTPIKPTEEGQKHIWNAEMGKVLEQKKALEQLPDELKQLMGGEAKFQPSDYEKLLRIAEKIKTFSPEDLAVYKMLALRATDNLDLFEKSVDMFLARKEELKKAMEEQAAKSKDKKPESMKEALDASWTGFDSSKIGKLSEDEQYDLARKKTWDLTKAQLAYMKDHPGETAADFAKSATLMNSGETFDAIGKDLVEAANGDANTFARWAAGTGAGAKLTGWMLAVGGVLYVLSWLTGIGELATIAGFMALMLASTIVLSTTESELRIKAASQAKTEEEFKTDVTKAAAARTNVLIMVAMLGLAFAIRFVAKTFFPETVARIKRSLAAFREKIRIVGKLSDLVAQIKTEMKGQRLRLVEAGETAKKSTVAQADAIDKMSTGEFVDKLESGSGDVFQDAAKQQGQKVPWRALAQTPEGLKAIEAYKADLADSLRNSVPAEIDAMIKEQVDALDAFLDKVDKAVVPDDLATAVKEYEGFFSDEEVAKRGKAKEEQTRKEANEKAVKSLEETIKQYDLAKKAAGELIAGAQGELQQTTADLQEVASANGGTMEGLDKAVKGEESLTRKINDRTKPADVKKKGAEKAVEASAAKVNDALRFTMLLDPATYVAKIIAVVAALKAKGYVFVKLWNGWTKSGGTYMGANATFKTPTGQIFELQFHTAETFKIKTDTHGLYEEGRSEVTTGAEKAKLDQQQRDAYKGVVIPEGIEKLDAIK